MKLRNSNILITGGGSGVGKAIAKRFVDEGADVVIGEIICGNTVVADGGDISASM